MSKVSKCCESLPEMASQPLSLQGKMTLQNTSSLDAPAWKNSFLAGKSSPEIKNDFLDEQIKSTTVGIIAVNIRKSMQKKSMAALLYTFDASLPATFEVITNWFFLIKIFIKFSKKYFVKIKICYL